MSKTHIASALTIPCSPPTDKLFKNLEGQRFGRLLVKSFYGTRRLQCGKQIHFYECLCDCGQSVNVNAANLRRGSTISCGCFRREFASKQSTKHGMYTSITYSSWSAMLTRCRNPNHTFWKHYGGRHVTFCERWMIFSHFLEDMGERPSLKYSLDRIDNNGNYCKENCRWATQKEQHRNTRSNRMITFQGKTACLTEWAEIIGVEKCTLHKRLKAGWSIEKMLTQKVRLMKPRLQ